MDCGLEGMRLLVGLEEKVAMDWLGIRVSTGIPGYGLRTEMIRKFFPFPLWKRFRKTGILERFPEQFFFRVSGTFGNRITLKSYICKYNTS